MTVRLLKVVRGRIPQVVDVEGQRVEYAPIPDYAVVDELRKKLLEEVAEYLVAGDFEELVDVLEAVDSLAARAHGRPLEDLLDAMEAKRRDRGSFAAGLGMYGPLRDEALE